MAVIVELEYETARFHLVPQTCHHPIAIAKIVPFQSPQPPHQKTLTDLYATRSLTRITILLTDRPSRPEQVGFTACRRRKQLIGDMGNAGPAMPSSGMERQQLVQIHSS